MTVCLDTNVLVQLFGTRQPFALILDALIDGRLELAASNEILPEYEETITHLSGPVRWQQVELFLHQISVLHGTILFIEPHFRFRVVTQDPDDNKFVDCAIAAEADFIITWDYHCDVLKSAGYKPNPITPEEFVAKHL
jgi:uncharacterized protein